jgi:hypothetical protein
MEEDEGDCAAGGKGRVSWSEWNASQGGRRGASTGSSIMPCDVKDLATQSEKAENR